MIQISLVKIIFLVCTTLFLIPCSCNTDLKSIENALASEIHPLLRLDKMEYHNCYDCGMKGGYMCDIKNAADPWE